MSVSKETIMAIYVVNKQGYFKKSSKSRISKTAAAADHYTVMTGIANRIEDIVWRADRIEKQPLGPIEIHTFNLTRTNIETYTPTGRR